MNLLRRARTRPFSSPRRGLIGVAWSAAFVAALSAGVGRADVVPPKAVDVADGWFALVDRGRNREAVAKYFDRSAPPAQAHAMLARLERAAPRRIARRSMTAWAGHGEGDQSRMMPGGYYSMVFDVVDRSGATGTDELRMVPRGDAWRVVDYVRTP